MLFRSLALTGGAAKRLAELTPHGHEVRVHLTLTDDYPWAQAFVILEALVDDSTAESRKPNDQPLR